jgi:hypothetical protein
MFAVVRHPDVAVPGVLPEEAMEYQRLQGWYRVSEFAAQPSDLDLSRPEFGPDAPDLDAEPEEKPKTARKATAKTTNTEEDEA